MKQTLISNATEWSPVKGYDNLYEISREGQIRSLHSRSMGKTVIQRVDRAGYYTVRLSKKGETSTQYLHRLLASSFIENPLNKPEINHISGNKLDNRIDNLEFVTHGENIQHAYNTGLIDKNRGKNHHLARPVLFKETGEIFDTIKDAAKKAGISYNTLRNHLNAQQGGPYSKIDISLN